MLYHLPNDHYQRELGARALERAGAPFALDDASAFRAGARRVWELYGEERKRARPSSLVGRATDRLDRLVYQRRDEHLDDPSLPEARRRQLIGALDRFNSATGAYYWVFRALERLLAGVGGEVTVLDLGSGHGAFPIRLAARGELGAARLRVIGSDIAPAYVAAAREAAALASVSVEFRELDALAIDRLDERFDVITCTQTAHHFPPDFLAELMARARVNARLGVLLFDARRSALTISLAWPALVAVSGGDPMFLHDGIVSIRRMYSPAELEMLARCAPGGEAYSARNYGPAYVLTEARLARQARA